MPITFRCLCGKVHTVPDVQGGRSGKCGQCGKRLAVPPKPPDAIPTITEFLPDDPTPNVFVASPKPMGTGWIVGILLAGVAAAFLQAHNSYRDDSGILKRPAQIVFVLTILASVCMALAVPIRFAVRGELSVGQWLIGFFGFSISACLLFFISANILFPGDVGVKPSDGAAVAGTVLAVLVLQSLAAALGCVLAAFLYRKPKAAGPIRV